MRPGSVDRRIYAQILSCRRVSYLPRRNMKGRLMKRATCPANGGALLQVKTMMSATTSTWDGMAADGSRNTTYILSYSSG